MSRSANLARGGLGPLERAVRIVGGVLLALIGLNLWLTTGGFIAWAWLGVALLGADFVLTGIRGYCPLYARLGIGRTRERRGAQVRGVR